MQKKEKIRGDFMKKNLIIRVPFIVAVIANFAFTAPSGAEEKSADKKTAPAKEQKSTTEKKTPDTPLVIPDPLPTDPTENAKIAEKILEKAWKKKCKTFVAVNREQGTEDISITRIYQKNNPDGTRWERNEDYYSPSGDTRRMTKVVYIQNDSGKWYIYPDIAIKLPPLSRSVPDISNDGQKEETFVRKHTVKMAERHGIACYLVTLSITTSDGSFRRMSQYYIGRDNFFLYRTVEYEENGKICGDIYYDNVEIDLPLDDKLFEINPNIPTAIPKTFDEYVELEADTIIRMEDKTLFITEDEAKKLIKLIN
jgi:hypothetical protein